MKRENIFVKKLSPIDHFTKINKKEIEVNKEEQLVLHPQLLNSCKSQDAFSKIINFPQTSIKLPPKTQEKIYSRYKRWAFYWMQPFPFLGFVSRFARFIVGTCDPELYIKFFDKKKLT